MTNDDLTKLCNHKRKIVAMAALHDSSASLQKSLGESDACLHKPPPAPPTEPKPLAKKGMSQSVRSFVC